MGWPLDQGKFYFIANKNSTKTGKKFRKDGQGPAYILPKEATTVNTGCYDQENIAGMMEPLGKVCPIDLEMGFFGASVRVKRQTSGKKFL